MFKKVYESFKNFIIENYHELILIIGFYIVMTYPLPYFVLVSGGTIDVSNRVEIVDQYKQKGSFNLAYVNELRGTLPTYLLSFIIPDWTLYKEEAYAIDDTEDYDDIAARDQMFLQESLQNSTMVAYKAANKKVDIIDKHYYIYYLYDFVKEYTDIRVGDELVSYDGIEFNEAETFREYVQTKKIGDEIKIEYERNGKVKNTILKVYEEDNVKYTGIVIKTIYDYETDPEIKFKFNKNESGSSGGLTLALAIYNKLTEEDITNGLKIVGTGTIEEDGTVGEIGGVEYKLQGAVKAKADIFIVPSGDNYNDAKKLKDEKKYKIKLIPATTFEETLEELKEYTNNK